MSVRYEQGRDTLLALVQTIKEFEGNEATTRLRLIDRMFQDVLSWSLEEIDCEVHVEGDYLDYVLGSPNRLAVVEAKRTSKTFDVPAGVRTGLVDISTVRDYNPSNRAAVDQVLAYCQEAGIGIAVLCNGHQYLGFLGSRSDGRKPIDGKAVYYASLDEIYADFPQFWDYFSREGLARGNLAGALQRRSMAHPAPPPLSSRIHDYPGYRIGSDMETDLRILGELFIQDIAREESISDEFLRECYCSSGALSQYAVVSKEILRSRYSVLSQQVNTESASNKKGPNPHIKEDLLASALIKRPIILLGDVGVGKSMFLKHLLRIDVTELLDRTAVIYVDFLKHSGLFDDVSNWIVSAVSSTLERLAQVDMSERSFVRSVYNHEINGFKRGIYGSLESEDPQEFRRREIDMLDKHISDEYEHARRSLQFLQGSRSMNFVIVLDNVDQHSPAFQEQIFVVGQSLAETWPAAVFMSLRPDTFHKSRRSGALAAYQPRVFTVSPPRADHVILKRLKFARNQLVEFGRLPGFPEGLTLDSSSLLVYIDVLLTAFESNEELIGLVDNLSSGNTRTALDFVSKFVGSGYVQTRRILQVHDEGHKYVIPLHEFLRAILYGDQKYYDPGRSSVSNLFAISQNDAKEHFLLPILLSTAERIGERESAGFVELSNIYKELQGIGYSGGQIDFHLLRAEDRDLVEVAEYGGNGRLVRITAAGGYLHKVLAPKFAYLDAIVVDTPIVNPAIRSEIRDVHDIHDRVERAQRFVEYLTDSWPFGADDVAYSWDCFCSDWAKELDRVRHGADRVHDRRVANGAFGGVSDRTPRR